jgi:peptidoglycan/LPS O-acetylase OafA/YrhL
VYPLYLLVLAWPVVEKWASGSLSMKLFALHALGMQSWDGDLDAAYAFVAPAWSISVELFLYATLPLLVAVVRLVDRRIWTLLGAIVGVVALLAGLALFFQHTGRAELGWGDPGSAHRWLYRTPLLRMGDFLLGILAARLYVTLRNRTSAPRLGRSLILPSAGLSLFLALQPSLLFSVWSWDVMYALPAAALILGLALAPRNPVSQVLAHRTVVFLGEASFAFYLIHHTLIGRLEAGAWISGVTVPSVAVELLNLGLVLAVAVGLHVGVEKPARVVVKRLLDRPLRSAATPLTTRHADALPGRRHPARPAGGVAAASRRAGEGGGRIPSPAPERVGVGSRQPVASP